MNDIVEQRRRAFEVWSKEAEATRTVLDKLRFALELSKERPLVETYGDHNRAKDDLNLSLSVTYANLKMIEENLREALRLIEAINGSNVQEREGE